MITLAYDLLSTDAEGCFHVGSDPQDQEPYRWHYWIPSLALLKPGAFRLRSTHAAASTGEPFIYPVELRWESLEWFRQTPPGTLLNHVPASVLEVARRGRAALVVSYAHEARSLISPASSNGESVSLYDLLYRFAVMHDLPPGALWFLNGNLDGHREFEVWRRQRLKEQESALFQVRWCEPFSFLAKYTLLLHERGQDLDIVWEAESFGRSGFSQHINTRLHCRPLSHALNDLYIYPEHLKTELERAELRPQLFLCMNRMPRDHRRYVVCHLFRQGLLPRGLVSFRDDEADDFRFDDPALERAWHALQALLPLTIDRHMPLDFASYSRDNFSTIKSGDAWPYRNSYFNYVTETCFFEDVRFVSEKAFKPMLHAQPFVLIGSPHTLAHLKTLGFRTFNETFDEYYDEEGNATARMEQIFLTLDHLSRLSQAEARDVLHTLYPVLAHNFHQLRTMTTPLETMFDEIQESLRA